MEDGSCNRLDSGYGGVERSTTQQIMKNSSNASQAAQKRRLSGNTLGSFPILPSTTKDAIPQLLPKREDDDANEAESESTKRGSSIVRQSQGRKRRASLRKTAMFGTGKLLREHRNSSRTSPKTVAVNAALSHESPEEKTPRGFSYENASLNSSSESGWPPSGKPSVSTTSTHDHDSSERPTPRILAPPVTNTTGPYASTTDDDEGLSFFRHTALTTSSSYDEVQLQPQPPGLASSLQRRFNRSAEHSTLTTMHTPVNMLLEDEWDYSETEWWGWVVLIVTWIVFVVGMGSCLGVWSWAWDVGETPYAPPELEDDPTLPITGYYPALMVCTAVMAWVWVVVAWVGMKYFRHAKEG